MPIELTVVHLADVPDAIPTLVRWFTEEWEPYYGLTGPGDAEHDITSCCNRDTIPTALVALDANGRIVGTAALKPESLVTHRHLSPWLAALLVEPAQRGRGIASALVAAIEDEARRLGCAVLYSDTVGNSTLLRRRGWQALDENIQTLREPATLYRLNLAPAGD